MRQSWTDDRLDDFVVHVDRRFDAVDQRFEQIDQRFEQVDRRFDRIETEISGLRADNVALRREMKDGFETMHAQTSMRFEALQFEMSRRFESLQRQMFQGCVAIVVGLVGVIAAIIGAGLA